MSTKKSRHVLAILRFIGASGREHLRGISTRLANRQLKWNIRFVLGGNQLTPDDITKIKQSFFDGIIVADRIGADVEDLIGISGRPVVTLSSGRGALAKRTLNATHIWLNDKEIGVRAAKELTSLGQFRSFAYIAYSHAIRWSMRREFGFREYVPKDVPFFQFNAQVHLRSSDNLRDWIKQLPKPAAIMASYDALGTQAIECCNTLAIPVPEQVAIIGVDNETTICDSSSPALTSIEPDRCSSGQRAVDELERLMRARKQPRAKNIVLTQIRVIKRGSTAPIAPSASLVDRCLTFLNREAPNVRSVLEVADSLGVSRRLLEMRVKANTGKTVHDLIVERRLKLAESLLRETDYSIDLISEKCGYGQSARLKYIFKDKHGISMSEWRISQGHT